MTITTELDFTDRVFRDSPPLRTRKLPGDLAGLSTAEELKYKLRLNGTPAFPYERELALYLLLVASLWPNDQERLLAAARIFSGALNFHFSRDPREVAPKSASSWYGVFRRELSSNIQSFNESFFFSKIGGPLSVLFCPSIEEFHRDLWKQVGELTMRHDFIEYLWKSSMFKRISSATFAYYAIADNVFDRKGGYGVRRGPMRKSAMRKKAGSVSTAESVRAKCKHMPENVILSFVMTRWCYFHWFDPSWPQFFPMLINNEVSSAFLQDSVSAIEERLLSNRATLNTSIAKWARTNSSPLNNPLLHTLSADELERAFKISSKVFPRDPLTQEEQNRAREKLKTVRSQIEPRFRPQQ